MPELSWIKYPDQKWKNNWGIWRDIQESLKVQVQRCIKILVSWNRKRLSCLLHMFTWPLPEIWSITTNRLQRVLLVTGIVCLHIQSEISPSNLTMGMFSSTLCYTYLGPNLISAYQLHKEVYDLRESGRIITAKKQIILHHELLHRRFWKKLKVRESEVQPRYRSRPLELVTPLEMFVWRRRHWFHW